MILGTATFNAQYNPDPYALPTTALIHEALRSGIRAFDTSPYYGPSETLLGDALATPEIRAEFPRESYRLLTKAGRIGLESFDYSPAWIRRSVRRSLRRLRTEYLDVVYCHDVEFVSPQEVVEAVRELRRLRDRDGIVRYIGISGYPVDVLCELAERVVRETGEPLDAVMSYAHCTVQNARLPDPAVLQRLVNAGVGVVPNASPLGMGLLRCQGPPVGGHGDWHPAPDGLRAAVRRAAETLLHRGREDDGSNRLEVVAIRYALSRWLRDGTPMGVIMDATTTTTIGGRQRQRRLGVNVLGVSNLAELRECLRVFQEVLDDHLAATTEQEPAKETPRAAHFRALADCVRAELSPEWIDYAWPSPPPGFVNTLPPEHQRDLEGEQETNSTTTPREKKANGNHVVTVREISSDNAVL